MKGAKTLIERNKPATEYNTDGHTLARLPDYLFVGPMRCGTSWIFNCLKRSGLVNLPLQKEIFYFDRNYHLGTAWYCGQFKSTDFKKPTVEVAPSLFHHPTAPRRVKDTLPHTKIIVITRETLTPRLVSLPSLKTIGFGGGRSRGGYQAMSRNRRCFSIPKAYRPLEEFFWLRACLHPFL